MELHRLHQVFTDVLIVGSGVAGLRTALECDPTLEILMITKGRATASNTHHAQGGVAVVLGDDDSVEAHVRDTLRVGCGLSDLEVVRTVCGGGEAEFRQLVEWGARFDKQGADWSLGLEGGHSQPRVVHVDGAQTGPEITRVLLQEAGKRPNIELRENVFLIDLLRDEDGIAGALVLNGDELLVVRAGLVVLASGGSGQVYRETSNPEVATGDGLAAALRHNAEIRNLEFVQFHPTTLYIAGAARILISEAVRGAGGRLIDNQHHPIMVGRHPEGDLAPRDVVSRAILESIRESGDTRVYLDVRHLDDFSGRFPGVDKVCRDFGVDPAIDLIPVHPSAHYHIGGVTVDLEGRTSLPGLRATGEVSCTGLHGANRLASNSLLEGLVLGARCGRHLAADWRQPTSGALEPPAWGTSEFPLDVHDLKRSMRHLMWRQAGIRRNAADLGLARAQLATWSAIFGRRRCHSIEEWEVRNMLAVSSGIVTAALERTVSCGTHFREDEAVQV